MRTVCRAAMLALILSGCAPSHEDSSDTAVAMHAVAIPAFKVGSSQTRFGALEFLGGLRLTSGNVMFGAASAVRFRPDHRHFIQVLDTGHWFTGVVDRDTEGRLAGISDARITPMLDEAGQTREGRGSMDAEGLALRQGSVLVSYEERHRVDAYPDPGFETSSPSARIPILMDPRALSVSQSLEALMVAPEASPLQGAAVLVTERSLDDRGNMLAAVLEGPLKGRFAVRHSDDFDTSDGVFLPGGDLLLLQRRFDLAYGMGVRILRIAGADIRPGALVDGKVIFEAGAGEQIDNMEGLDAFRADDGTIHLIMVSDDNHSVLQRSLMLEFRLVGE